MTKISVVFGQNKGKKNAFLLPLLRGLAHRCSADFTAEIIHLKQTLTTIKRAVIVNMLLSVFLKAKISPVFTVHKGKHKQKAFQLQHVSL